VRGTICLTAKASGTWSPKPVAARRRGGRGRGMGAVSASGLSRIGCPGIASTLAGPDAPPITKSALARLGRHRVAAVAATTTSFIRWCLPVTVSTRMIPRLANGDCGESRLCWIRSHQSTWLSQRQEMGWTCLPLNRGPALAMPKPPPEPGDDPEPYAEVLKTFGRTLKAARLRSGLTHDQFGAKAGLKRSFVFELESGGANVTLKTLAKVADVLEMHPQDFLPKSGGSLISGTDTEVLLSLLKRIARTLSARHIEEQVLIGEIARFEVMIDRKPLKPNVPLKGSSHSTSDEAEPGT
jgi:transcriptional regulator with XRE-family HTH domain